MANDTGDPQPRASATAGVPLTLPGENGDRIHLDQQAGEAPISGPSSALLQPPACVSEVLDDAEQLLRHAAETGTEIETTTRDNILHARSVGPAGWDEKAVADLFTAFTELAAELKPVTAESLRSSRDEDQTEPVLRKYRMFAVGLAICIAVSSFVSFITTALSNTISAKINTANALAAQLRAQLGAPPESSTNSLTTVKDRSIPPQGVTPLNVITELQDYAATIRDIESRSEQLNLFIACAATEFHLEQLKAASRKDPQQLYNEFQLEVGLPDLWKAESDRTKSYQHVRAFAQSAIDDTSMFYGAFANCILPVLYAVFGACAYLLRNYAQQMKARAYVPCSGDSARFVIAAIGGAVVGLFNFTVTQGTSVSPLAIAFLVGYGVDVFFSFLESLLQALTRGKASS